ncbi:MAG: hypothetical protein ACLFQV_13340 [Vulcanimicrobiota bacterium]
MMKNIRFKINLIGFGAVFALVIYVFVGIYAPTPENLIADANILLYIFFPIVLGLLFLLWFIQRKFYEMMKETRKKNKPGFELINQASYLFAICEVPGIMALMFKFLSGNIDFFYFFIGLSFILLMIYWPRL